VLLFCFTGKTFTETTLRNIARQAGHSSLVFFQKSDFFNVQWEVLRKKCLSLITKIFS